MTSIPPGMITVADLYQEMVGLRTDISNVSTQVSVINERDTQTGRILADHESRLRVLEGFRWLVLGGATIAGGAAGWIVTLLAHHP